jgi:hypothetical protein
MQTRAFALKLRRHLIQYPSPRESLGVGSDDSIGDVGRLLVLPHPEYLPATGRQSGVDRFVARYVPRELWAPVIGVSAWDVAVLGTAMPEAPVDEDGKASPGEDNVGTNKAPRGAEGKIDAEAQAAAMELRAEAQLSAAVSPPVSAHARAHLGASGLRIGQGPHRQIQAWHRSRRVLLTDAHSTRWPCVASYKPEASARPRG